MTAIDPGLIAAIIILSSVITVCFSFYVAHTYIEEFERCLPNCKFIEDNKRVFSSAGLPGKIMRCNMIYCFLWIPGLGERRGLLDMKEIKRFPVKFKYLLTIPWTAQIVLLIALILLIQLTET
jgi:hypothetical protein